MSPGENGKVDISLYGEDKRLITNQQLSYSMQKYQRFMLQQKLAFTIPGPAEYARLEIKTRDRWGRDMSVSSVDLLLLAMGSDEPFPPISLLEPYIIWYPEEAGIVQGGTLLVNGLVKPVNPTPLIFELIDESGQLVGSTQLNPPAIQEGQTHAPFTVAIPYRVNSGTNARLIIRQESVGRIPGTVAMTSVQVSLNP